MSRSRMPKLLSMVYVHNPFYLISACLFVFGLKLLFRNGDSSVLFQRGSVGYIEPWGLLGSLAGITLLMAVTAILIVRFGKVWDDARSLILIVLLMLMAIAVSMDELANMLSENESMQHLALLFAAGTSFAVVIGELLIRGLGIRLSAGYRLPLYGFMVLFFASPVLLLREVTLMDAEATRWLIAAFPMAAGLLTLTLIPAIRRGSAVVVDNGTPWKWPSFPWTPFVFIALAVCFRSYSLTMSFDPLVSSHFWDTTFGIYQLVPFLLAVLVVMLEIGIAEKLIRLQQAIMLAAPALLILAYPWLVPWSRLPGYANFTYVVVDELASPVFLTAIGLGLMYLWAWWKGVRHAEAGVFGMVLLLTMIGPRAFGYRTWHLSQQQMSWWPLLALAALQIVFGIRRRKSLRTFAGLLIVIFVAFKTVPSLGGFSEWPAFLVVHLFLISVLSVGILFRDGFSEILRQIGPPLVSCTMIVALALLNRSDVSAVQMAGYAVGMTLLPLGLAWFLSSHKYLLVVYLHCGLAVVLAMASGVVWFFRSTLPAGVKPVVLGISSFLIAVFISVLKSGVARRIRMYWLTKHRRTVA